MELLAALQWRYAPKKMNGKAVPQEKIDRILDAVRLTPSSMGLQPYTILLISSPEIKKQLLPVANNQQQIVDSSHLLIFAAWDNITAGHIDAYIELTAATRNVTLESLAPFKNSLLNLTTRPQATNFEWAARQTYIALGTAIAAAAEERVDATPMEGFNNAAVDEILGLKEKGLRSVTMLPLGYRDTANDWLVNFPKVRRTKEALFLLQ